MFKKIIVFVILAVMLFSFSACTELDVFLQRITDLEKQVEEQAEKIERAMQNSKKAEQLNKKIHSLKNR